MSFLRFVRRVGALVSTGVVLVMPHAAFAHAFGQQYTLPLPVSLYLLGGVSAFIASCAVIFLFSDPHVASEDTKNIRVYTGAWVRPLYRILQSVGVGAFVFAVSLSFFGTSDFTTNPLIGLFWIGLLLCVTYMSVFLDGIWDRLNPFATCVRWFRAGQQPRFTYLQRLGSIPAYVLFFGLIWLELFSNGLGTSPTVIGSILVFYLMLCVIGSELFGITAWFEHAEVFSVFFRLIGAGAPLRLKDEGVECTVPASRLVQGQVADITRIFFILLVLSSTSLDGIIDTAPWRSFTFFLYHLGITLGRNGPGPVVLLIAPFISFGLYALAIYLMKRVTRTAIPFRHLLLRFGYSLVPIAIAYHVAHYFTLLLVEGQRLVIQLSDPFAQGWNLFGAAHDRINAAPLGADVVWYLQLSIIVLGHVVAAIVAHRIAVRVFKKKSEVIVGQLPMLVLMVFYTAFGLWILAQPFVPLGR